MSVYRVLGLHSDHLLMLPNPAGLNYGLLRLLAAAFSVRHPGLIAGRRFLFAQGHNRSTFTISWFREAPCHAAE